MYIKNLSPEKRSFLIRAMQFVHEAALRAKDRQTVAESR